MADTSITVRLIDETRSGFSSINTSLNGLSTKIDSIERDVAGLAKSFIALGTAIAGSFAVKEIVQTAAQFETFRATLGAVTGSVTKGNVVFEELKVLAVDTVFGVKDLTEAYIKLAAAGIPPSTKQLKMFNDIASVTADQVGTLQAITDLYARTVGGGLGLEELNRLADRGIPVYKMLSDTLGINRLEISKLGQTAEGTQLILKALEEGFKKLEGAADKQAGSLARAYSQLKDSVSNLSDALGQAGLNKALTDVANSLNAFIKDNPYAIKQIGEGLAGAVRFAGDAFKFLYNNIQDIITAAGIFFTVMAVQKIYAIGTALAAAAASGNLLALTLNRIPFAAIATVLGMVALKAMETKKATEELTEAEKQANAQEIIRLQNRYKTAQQQEEAKKLTEDEIYQTLSLSDRMAVLNGNTRLVSTAKGEMADQATKLLKGQGYLTSEFAKYNDQLDKTIALSDKDSVAKRISTETTKALEIASKSATDAKVKLTEADKAAITESIRYKIVTDETNQALIKSAESLRVAEAKTLDSIGQYLAEQAKLRTDFSKSTLKNQEVLNNDLETLRLNYIAKDIQFQREAQRNNLTDLERFSADVVEATRKRAIEQYKTDEELNNQLLALRTNFEQKYKSIIENARTVNMTETERYLDRLAKLDEEYNTKGLEKSAANRAARLAEEKIFNSSMIKEARDFRISEGGATEAYNAKLLELQQKFAASSTLDEETKLTLLRKLNKEYRDGITSEYGTLYNDLNKQILNFTGQTQEQFNRTKEIVKLVFGVDLQDVIKNFFASAIRYVLGFRESTSTEMNAVKGIFDGLFGGTGSITDIFKGFASNIGNIFSGIGSFISNIFSGGGSLFSTLSSWASSALGLFSNFGSSVASAVGGVVSSVGAALGVGGAAAAAGTAAATGGAAAAVGGAAAIGGTAAAITGGAAAGGTAAAVGAAELGGAAAAASGGGITSALGTLGGIGLAVGAVALIGNYIKRRRERNRLKGAQRDAENIMAAVAGITGQGIGYRFFPNNPNEISIGKMADDIKNWKTYQIDSTLLNNKFDNILNKYKLIKYSDLAFYWAMGGEEDYRRMEQEAQGSGVLDVEGNFVPNAKGAVLRKPIAFPLGGNDIGLAGEAGPEGILPLGRTSDGRLGVISAGGDGGMNINFTINAVDATGIEELLMRNRSLITNIVRDGVRQRGVKI